MNELDAIQEQMAGLWIDMWNPQEQQAMDSMGWFDMGWQELTDEEFDARFAKYEAEYNQLDEEAIALETRAGFLEE